MSLLKRIESARPGASGDTSCTGGSDLPGHTRRRAAEVPARPGTGWPKRRPSGAFVRDVKFRIQNRVIQDLDPKLDLSNQVEVRRQIGDLRQGHQQGSP